MNLIKIITILNWAVIGLLGILVILETLTSTKGGDAYGRAMGQLFYYIAIFAIVLLLILNLLPYNWSKYTALAIILLPVLYMMIAPVLRKMKSGIAGRIQEAKPFFDDPERESLARVIRDGEPEKLQKLLQTPSSRLNEGGEVLIFAVNEAASSSYKPKEKIECVKRLLEAGASLDSANTLESPIHMFTASVGNATLLRLLLEHGASPNARQYYNTHYILLETIDAYQEPEASVRTLLEFGADPNVTGKFDDDKGKVTPLYRAAQLGRWGVCLALLEKGADPEKKADDGTSFWTYYDEADKGFDPDGYSTREDFERLKALVKKR